MRDKTRPTIVGEGWKEELPATAEILRATIFTAHNSGDFELAISRPDGWRIHADVFNKEWGLRIFGPGDPGAAQAVRLDCGLANKVSRWTMMRRLLSHKKAIFTPDEVELILSDFMQGATRPVQAAWIDFIPKR